MQTPTYPWEGPLVPLDSQTDYSAIAHRFLNPEWPLHASDIGQPSKKRAREDETQLKIPVESKKRHLWRRGDAGARAIECIRCISFDASDQHL